jgi:hypothetical protein
MAIQEWCGGLPRTQIFDLQEYIQVQVLLVYLAGLKCVSRYL